MKLSVLICHAKHVLLEKNTASRMRYALYKYLL